MFTKSTRRIPAVVLAAAVASAISFSAPGTYAVPKAVSNDDAARPGAAVPDLSKNLSKKRSESQFARELSRLGQWPVLKVLQQEAHGTPSEKLFAAQLIYAQWSDLSKDFTKDRNARDKISDEYLADLTAALSDTSERIDGFWALDQAKFILGPIAEPTVNRMEYWANNPKDRKKLMPMAQLARRLLGLGKTGLQFAQEAAERPTFNEAAWTTAYNAFNEVDYYSAYAGYFTALGTEPGSPARAKGLAATAELLKKWADEDPNAPAGEASGIKYQCLLLRGKVYSEAGKFEQAAADFAAAGNAPSDKAPGWIRYQAHYQAVVNKMRKHDPTAPSEVELFKKWVVTDPETSKDETAKVSAEMLHYRVEESAAQAITAEKDRQASMNKAMDILGDIVQKDPRYRDLVFAQLSAQAPDGAPFSSLPPLQALAVAWTKVQSVQDDKSAEARKVLDIAVQAAMSVRANPAAGPNDRREATLIAAVADARLGRLIDAVEMDLDFARICNEIETKGGAKDPRGKQMVDTALSQLGDLRSAVAPGQPQPKRVLELSAEALDLASGKFGDHKWDYANGLTAMQEGNMQKAALIMQGISQTDPNYFSSRYQLLRINLQLLNQATDPNIKQQTARSLVESCEGFLRPPSNATPAALKQIEDFKKDILLIEASTALDPLKDPGTALAALDKLKVIPDLSSAAKGVILRDRIKAYQIQGSSTDATNTMREYLDLYPTEAPNIIRGMISEDLSQIERVEKTDPVKSKEIASNAVVLIKALIESTKQKTGYNPKDVYAYRQILADMESRAGQVKDSIELFKALQAEDPKDMFNFMGEARAMFADGQWNYAHDYFGRILQKLSIGSDSYWEAYLRCIQCNEKIGTPEAKAASKKALQDLRASYSDTIGGTAYKTDYMEMLKKYDIP